MIAAVKAAAKAGDSLGGVAEVLAYGVPVGLGSHVHWDRKLDANLAQALMSHPGGEGGRDRRGLGQRAGAAARQAHDAILYDEADGYVRPTDRAGGIEGGISNGALDRGPGRHEAAGHLEPAGRSRRSTWRPRSRRVSFRERTDVTAVPAMGVVAEIDDGTRAGQRGIAQVRRRLAGRDHPATVTATSSRSVDALCGDRPAGQRRSSSATSPRPRGSRRRRRRAL